MGSRTSEGRKTIHRKMEEQMFDKQMFGKQIFALPPRDNGTQREYREDSRQCASPTPNSLWLSLVLAVFLDQTLYLNFFD